MFDEMNTTGNCYFDIDNHYIDKDLETKKEKPPYR